MSTPTPDRPPWRLIGLDEVSIPTEPPSEAIRIELRTLWKQFRRKKPEDAWHENGLGELLAIPDHHLARLIPAPTWEAYVAPPIMRALGEYLAAEQDNPCLLLIAPPFSGMNDAVSTWATNNSIHRLPYPTPDQILKGQTGWPQHWPESADDLLVITGLERYFLRHHQGLNDIRRLVDLLWNTHQRCVVVCHSWAWQFLIHVAPVDLLHPRPLTLAPFHAPDLDCWLAEMPESYGENPASFLRMDNRKKALRVVDSDADDYSDEFLGHLSAHARGNPVVAWSLWKLSLQIATEEGSDSPDDDVNATVKAQAAKTGRETVWVKPWEKVPLPELPAGLGDADEFILHALLVHNGLPGPTLEALLSGTLLDIPRSLRCLQTGGVITLNQECWHVAPEVYPAVRTRLRLAGFLTDMF